MSENRERRSSRIWHSGDADGPEGMAGFILARRGGGAATGLVGAEECVDRGGRAQADAGAVSIRYHRLGATSERPTIWELSDFVLQ